MLDFIKKGEFHFEIFLLLDLFDYQRVMTDKIPRIGVGVLIVNRKLNKILLGERLVPSQCNTFSFPGGKLEFGEEIWRCGIREVYEETGLKISRPVLYRVFNDVHPSGLEHWIAHVLVAFIDDDQKPVNREPEKCAGWDWYHWDEVPNRLFSSARKTLVTGTLEEVLGIDTNNKFSGMIYYDTDHLT